MFSGKNHRHSFFCIVYFLHQGIRLGGDNGTGLNDFTADQDPSSCHTSPANANGASFFKPDIPGNLCTINMLPFKKTMGKNQAAPFL